MIELHWSTVLLLLILAACAVYGLARWSGRRITKDWASEREFGP